MPLFQKEETIILDYLKKEINKIINKNIISIILYGSFASGKAKLTSDIDVMIISQKTNLLNKKLNKLKQDFLKNDLLLRIDILNLAEFKKLYKQKEPLIRSIIKNHKIICGKKISEIL